MASVDPVTINSYIILDLETTGLPSIQLKTKITELSILCLDRSQLLHTYEINRNDKFMPRIVNKLNLCLYPKKFINVFTTEVTGLSNELLQHCKPFDDDIFDIIHKVIAIMEPPACILAHNGIRFDFPILRSEIAHIGKALPDTIYCADTLLAFRQLLPKPGVQQVETVDRLSYNVASELDITINASDEENDAPVEDEITKIDWGSENLNDALNLAAEEAERRYLHEVGSVNLSDIEKNNETTPKFKKSQFSEDKIKLLNKKNGVSKKLFTENPTTAPRNYQLNNVYNFLTGKHIVNAHQADSDTHALLECIVALGPGLLEWIDSNCKPFNDIKKLW